MSCNFCEDIYKKNRELGLPEKESILYEDENIYVMPDIAPLAIGHLLVFSKKHFQGYASADAKTLESLSKFLQYYKKRIKGRIFTVFEHGAVISYHAGASIDHAHMHILPYEIPIKEKIMEKYDTFYECSVEQLSALYQKKQPYFFCMKSNEYSGWVFEVGKVPSQILRKFANEALGKIGGYNWKEQYFTNNAYIYFYKSIIWWKGLNLTDSFKWKKKLILEKYGFTDYKSLLEEITRLPRKEMDILLPLLKKEMEQEQQMYRVVLVSLKHRYSLPNYIISKEEDIDNLKLWCEKQFDFNEIWYLENRKVSKYAFSGRISFFKQGAFYESIIEMISGDDIRSLEKYSIGQNKIPYLRAIKQIGMAIYQVEENRMYHLEKEALQVLEYVKREIAIYTSELLYFCQCIFQYGIRGVSLDFRVEDKKIIFIDWDTSDDEMVLKHEFM